MRGSASRSAAVPARTRARYQYHQGAAGAPGLRSDAPGPAAAPVPAAPPVAAAIEAPTPLAVPVPAAAPAASVVPPPAAALNDTMIAPASVLDPSHETVGLTAAAAL